MLNNQGLNETHNSNNTLKEKINSIPIVQVAAKLGLTFTKNGSTPQGNCPTGHPSKGGTCFSININDNYWHCFHCKAGGDNLELIMTVNSMGFAEAIEWAVREFNITETFDSSSLVNEELSSEQKEAADKFRAKAMLYEKAFEYMHGKLFEAEGKEAYHYLTVDRKYDPQILKQSEFCAFTSKADIREYLIEQFPDAVSEINTLPLNGAYGDSLNVAIPYRNRDGIITGFMKRASEPEGITVTLDDGTVKQNIRWDSTFGLSKHDLFNLDKCKEQKTLLIVEGYPDAAYLYYAGINNITAVGQGRLSKSHLEGLKLNNVKNVIISFDNDDAGPSNTEGAIKLILEETDITPFVLDPLLLAPYKDPDEYVRANGLDAFKEILNKVEHGIKWMLNRIIRNYDLTNDLQRQEAFNSCIGFELQLRNDLDREILVDSISCLFTLPKEAVRSQLTSFRERSKKIEHELRQLTQKGNELIKEKNIIDCIDLIHRKSTELKTHLGISTVTPQKPFEVELEEMFLRDDTRNPNVLLGLPLTKFSTLALHIDGIQPGFYIIGAEPHIGKTALMTGICLDVLQTNIDAKVIYYSLDDSSFYTAYRMLSIMTGKPINQVKRKQLNQDDQDLLVAKRQELVDLMSSKRLMIKDLGVVSDISELEADIKSVDDFSKLVVFIDGLFNLGVGNGGESIRVENIERANTVKTLTDTYNIPIFTTAELRKKLKTDTEKKKPTMSDIMETGKFAYNANVVFLMSPVDPSEMINSLPILNLEYAKNKLSDFRDTQYLLFERAKGLISEYHLKPSTKSSTKKSSKKSDKNISKSDEQDESGGENLK